MKLFNKEIELINALLHSSIDADDEIVEKSRLSFLKNVALSKYRNRELDLIDVKEEAYSFWTNYLSRMSNRYYLTREEREGIIVTLMSLLPSISLSEEENGFRDDGYYYEQKMPIYYYSRKAESIRTNGLEAEMLSMNEDAEQEIFDLFADIRNDFASAESINEDEDLSRIYQEVISTPFNTFAYTNIDCIMLETTPMYFNSAEEGLNKISTTMGNFFDDATRGNVSETIIHGFVRYDRGEDTLLYDFLSLLVKKVWKKMSSQRAFIESLIKIVALFVKKEISNNGESNIEKKEYKFVYVNLTANGIPRPLVKFGRKTIIESAFCSEEETVRIVVKRNGR